MTNTRRGHDTERRCASLLRGQGYDVIRSAASKSIWDIVAVGRFDIKLIQCKRTLRKTKSAAAPKSVIKEMEDALAPKNGCVSKQLWTWVDRQGWVVTTI